MRWPGYVGAAAGCVLFAFLYRDLIIKPAQKEIAGIEARAEERVMATRPGIGHILNAYKSMERTALDQGLNPESHQYGIAQEEYNMAVVENPQSIDALVHASKALTYMEQILEQQVGFQ